jgi:hypothetical protein
MHVTLCVWARACHSFDCCSVQIISINNKIKKLEEAAHKNVGVRGLLAFKEKIDKLKIERAQLYSSFVGGLQETEKHNGGGAGPSGSK